MVARHTFIVDDHLVLRVSPYSAAVVLDIVKAGLGALDGLDDELVLGLGVEHVKVLGGLVLLLFHKASNLGLVIDMVDVLDRLHLLRDHLLVPFRHII